MDMGTITLGVAVIALLLTCAALIGVHKLGGFSALTASVKAHDFGAARDQMLAGLRSEMADVKGRLDAAMAPTASANLQPAYIDRDDFMKAIGASNFAFAVTVDGKLVHNGQSPAVAYVTKPDGSIATA